MSLDVYLKCEHCGSELYTANITHNLNAMAEAAGIYRHLWRPDELDIRLASHLIEPLRAGIEWLKAHSEEARKLEPENRWGTYEDFVPWVERYRAACVEHPDAQVEVWR